MRIRGAARRGDAPPALGDRHAAVSSSALGRCFADELRTRSQRARRAGADKASDALLHGHHDGWGVPILDQGCLGCRASYGVGSAHGHVNAAAADDDRGHSDGCDQTDRADDQTRPLAGRPDQERSGEHVADQSRARDLTARAQFVFKGEKLLAVPIPDSSWIQLEQRAHQTRAHAGWIPIRARPTRVIFSSRLS